MSTLGHIGGHSTTAERVFCLLSSTTTTSFPSVQSNIRTTACNPLLLYFLRLHNQGTAADGVMGACTRTDGFFFPKRGKEAKRVMIWFPGPEKQQRGGCVMFLSVLLIWGFLTRSWGGCGVWLFLHVFCSGSLFFSSRIRAIVMSEVWRGNLATAGRGEGRLA